MGMSKVTVTLDVPVMCGIGCRFYQEAYQSPPWCQLFHKKEADERFNGDIFSVATLLLNGRKLQACKDAES